MSKTLAISLAAVLIAALAPFAGASAAETTLTLDKGISAILNIPDGADHVPAVLMLHGFGSSKDEVGDMYKREAAALAARGIGSLRIDFEGFGKSDGDTGATTVDGQLADAEIALAYLQGADHIDRDRLGVLGFSLGGGIAILLASKHPDDVKSLVTWSSVGDFHKDFLEEMGQETFDRAAKEGIVALDLGWRTMALKKSFFESLDHFDLSEAVKGVKASYMAIAGNDDFSSAYAEKFVVASGGPIKQTINMPGEDHIFHVLSDNQKAAEEVISKTADWFGRTLVAK